ncbi:SMI1/KNR4 family protein [Candidatus Stoquefichus massiliensis]|uniref:SMI1/KNR4 family protein n=1 Tax=Candidatus Stoquefichus massiliensis TaxID=1470350 RepID=UPI0004818613|nr:SMI1/KNR4 family protein [Candidatus Stoquefichus massiliensis]
MNKSLEQEFIEKAFLKLMERGWIKGELKCAHITEEDLNDLEKKYNIQLPNLYKAFLTTYQLPCSTVSQNSLEINGIVYQEFEEEPDILWLILDAIKDISSLSARIDEFREIAVDCCEAPQGSYLHLIPIGDWGAGWGPLCIDLELAKQEVDYSDQSTWSIVWFDHEEFDWQKCYLEDDGLLHGRCAAPDFETLLEWYFIGTLEEEFEKNNQVKLNFEKLSNMDFCESYWEDRWKEYKQMKL